MRSKKKLLLTLGLSVLLAGSFFTNAKALGKVPEEQDDPLYYIEKQKQELSDRSSGLMPISGGQVGRNEEIHNDQYVDCEVIEGIDISKYQANIDWKKVKADGIDFAIVRVAYRGTTTGELGEDTMYETNLKNANEAGVDVGVYIFSQAITEKEAREEADYAINLSKKYNIHLPVVMDYEYSSSYVNGKYVCGGRLYNAHLSKAKATKVISAFCDDCEKKGYVGMVYAGKNLMGYAANGPELAEKYPIWFAHYTQQTNYEGWMDYWQYSSIGRVSGISGNVDMDVRYMKEPDQPENLKITAKSYTGVSLKWDRVRAAYGYKVYSYDEETDELTLLKTLKGIRNTSCTLTDLPGGEKRNIAVTAYYHLYDGDDYESDYSLVSSDGVGVSVDQITTSATENSITINWVTYPTIKKHGIFKSLDGKKYEMIAELDASVTTFTEKDLTIDSFGYYQVRAGIENSSGGIDYLNDAFTKTLKLSAKLNAPKKVKVKSYDTESISLTWNKVANAVSYNVYDYDAEKDKYTLLGFSEENSITLSELESGAVYNIRVCGVYNDFDGNCSETLGAATSVARVSGLRPIAAGSNYLNFTWNEVMGATGYEVYGKITGSYKKLATTTEDRLSWVKVKKLEKGKKYTFKVRGFVKVGNKKYYGEFSDTVKASTRPDAVKNLKATSTSNSITLKWKKVKNADGYYIYRYNSSNKTYEKIDQVKTNKYTNKKLGRRTNYSYKVAAYRKFGKVTIISVAKKVKKQTK